MIENTQEITMIIMKPTAITKCQIGQDWYKNELEITMLPDETYPDYMKVQGWVMTNIDGKELNIEDVVEKVFRYVSETYKPKQLRVTDNVTGNKVHFDVVVIKE